MASLFLNAALDGADIGCNYAVVTQYAAIQTGGDRRGVTIPRPTGDITYIGVSRATFPRTYLNFDGFPTAFTRVVNVNTMTALKNAISNAQVGDAIVVDNTATYTGNITNFPILNGDNAPGGNGCVTIISKAIYDTLVSGVSTVLPNKKRVLNTASLVRHINADMAGQAHIEMDGPTKGWRFVGWWFDLDPALLSVNRYIRFGNGNLSSQPNATLCPMNVGIDRCYFGGHANSQVRHAVEAHAKNWYVIDSFFSDYVMYADADSQCVSTYNGPGPGAIINNRMAATTMPFLAGGAPAGCGTPSDVEVKWNYVTRPLSQMSGHPTWDGKMRQIKNGGEVKNAAYWDIAYNLVENIPPEEQDGFAFLCKAEPYGDTAGGYTHDIIYRHNRVKNVPCGINVAAVGDNNGGSAPPPYRICSFGNLGTEMAAQYFNLSSGRYIGLLACDDVSFIHDTWVPSGVMNSICSFPDPIATPFGNGLANRLRIEDCIFGPTTYGMKADGTVQGNASLNSRTTDYNVKGNVLVDIDLSQYPAGNFTAAGIAGVKFTNVATGDWSLEGTTQTTGGGSGGGGTTDPPNIGTIAVSGRNHSTAIVGTAKNIGTIAAIGGPPSVAINYVYSPNIGTIAAAGGPPSALIIGLNIANVGTIAASGGGPIVSLVGFAVQPPPVVIPDPTTVDAIDDETPVTPVVTEDTIIIVT